MGNLAGGRCRAFRQFAYFVGDHGKAAAGFPGSGGLDCRIKRQQVGLVGNILDHRHDVRDLLRLALEVVHLLGRFPDDRGRLGDLPHQPLDRVMPFVGLCIGIHRDLGRFARVVGNDIDGDGELLDAGSDGRRCTALNGRRLVQLTDGCVEVIRCTENRLRAAGRLAHRIAQRSLHLSHGLQQLPDFIAAGGRQLDGQIALGDLVRPRYGPIQPGSYTLSDKEAAHQGQRNSDHQRRDAAADRAGNITLRISR